MDQPKEFGGNAQKILIMYGMPQLLKGQVQDNMDAHIALVEQYTPMVGTQCVTLIRN